MDFTSVTRFAVELVEAAVVQLLGVSWMRSMECTGKQDFSPVFDQSAKTSLVCCPMFQGGARVRLCA
jgi:hypothetical protein